MTNMICAAFEFTPSVIIGLALLGITFVVGILVAFVGPKNKDATDCEQKTDVITQSQVEKAEEAEPIEEQTVAIDQNEVDVAEQVEVVDEPAPQAEVAPVQVEEEAVECTPVTLQEPIVDHTEDDAADGQIVIADEVVATTPVNKFLNIPVGKKRTFAEKMIDADEENQAIYNMLKNELMSYKKVSNRCTKIIDIFKHKSTYLAKVGLTGKTVKLHLALDPSEYKVTKYHHQDLGEKKKYEFVPLALKVKSPRSQKYAVELIAGVMQQAGLEKNPQYEQKDYVAEMKASLSPVEEPAK